MKAEEFEIALRRLNQVRTELELDYGAENHLVVLLKLTWNELDRHRLEMEAAEKPVGEAPTLVDVGDLRKRFDAIKTSLAETDSIAETHENWLGRIWKRLTAIERKAKHVDLLVSAVYSYLDELHPDFVPPSQPSENPVRAEPVEAPPIEVKMRVQQMPTNVVDYWVWQHQLAGMTFAEIGICGEARYTSAEVAKIAGNTWLATLSEGLGIKLKAVWLKPCGPPASG